MSRRLLCLSMATIAGLCFAQAALSQSPPPAELSEAAILAKNSVHIKKGAAITGDVIVNDPSSGPVLLPGADLVVDRDAVVDGDVRAASILLNRNSQVLGDIFTDLLIDKGSIDPRSEIDYEPSVFDPFPTFQSASGIDRPDETAPENGELVLDPGEYGHITIDKGGRLVLTGGLYEVLSVSPVTSSGGPCDLHATAAEDFFACRSIAFEGPTDLRVFGTFDMGKDSYVGPEIGASVGASDIVVFVGGANGDPDDPNSLPPAATIGKDSVLVGTLFADNGTVLIDKGSTVVGSLIGRDVRVDGGVARDPFFINQLPVAFSRDVTLEENQSIVVTLEGFDPEGGDLAFSIDGLPGLGTLSGGECSVSGDPCDDFEGSTECVSGETCQPRPIVPATTGRCSVSQMVCDLVTGGQCPGGAGDVCEDNGLCSSSGDFCCPVAGETCEPVVDGSPNITQATVVYTPTDCTVDDEGDYTCPADSFTFFVTDVEALDSNIATVDVGPDDATQSFGLTEVVAEDIVGTCSLSGDSCLDVVESSDCPVVDPERPNLCEQQLDAVVEETLPIALHAGVPAGRCSTSGDFCGDLADSSDCPIEETCEPIDLALTFRITTLPGSGALTDSAGKPIEQARDLPDPTVKFTGSAAGAASFEFSARETGTDPSPCSAPTCDEATVLVDISPEMELAPDQRVSTRENQRVEVTLLSNPGGAGQETSPPVTAAAAVTDALPGATVAGSVTDTDGDGFGDVVDGTYGRLVYLGNDPSSTQHGGSPAAAPPWLSDNPAVVLAGNATRWAADEDNPSVACIEDPDFVGEAVASAAEPGAAVIASASPNGSGAVARGTAVAQAASGRGEFQTQAVDMMAAAGLSCTSIFTDALATADLSAYEVLYFAALASNVADLLTAGAQAKIGAFVESGGGLVVEANVFDPDSWTWVPFASQIGHSGETNVSGATAVIVAPNHPVMANLSDQDLSNWGISVHTTFDTPAAAGFTALATDGAQTPYIIVRDEELVLPELVGARVDAGGAVTRVQIEFDISSIDVTDPEDIEQAEVTLTTESGPADRRTEFFFGTTDQDGFLAITDFEAASASFDDVVMPASIAADPQTGVSTFVFDVTAQLQDALTAGFEFFSIQGRVLDEATAPDGEGLRIRSTADGNPAGSAPRLDVTIVEPPDPLIYTVLEPLPTFGTLKTLGGEAIVIGQNNVFQEVTTLVYQPNDGVSGVTDSVSYRVTQETKTDTATILIDIAVTNFNNCETNASQCDDGRNGTSPSSGGSGGSGSAADPEPEHGVSLSVVVEGKGTVTSSPRVWRRGGGLAIQCGGECSAKFEAGEQVVLYARPTGASSEFAGWRGSCSGQGPVTVVTVAGNGACTAVFRERED